jgi:hypothetical protein
VSCSSSVEVLSDAARSDGRTLIYRDERTCVHRIAGPGGSTIICKERLGADAHDGRLRHVLPH